MSEVVTQSVQSVDEAGYSTIQACRICGSDNLQELLTLGDQYVSDFVTQDKVRTGPCVPITLVLCNGCTLVQQLHSAPSQFMFSRHYWYRSGMTATMEKAMLDVIRSVQKFDGLHLEHPGTTTIDIGSNDGTLLRLWKEQYPSMVTVGVEPAQNLREIGSRGVDVLIPDFWDADDPVIQGLPSKPKIITALGMFYDLEDPCRFIEDVAKTLHPEGLFVAQLMCLKNMLSIGDLGNLAHEHLEFYSLKSLIYLFGKFGLEIFDIETNKVNGESYRLYVRHKGAAIGSHRGRWWVEEALSLEAKMWLDRPEIYRTLQAKFEATRHAVRVLLSNLADSGKRIWGYGASTKGNVLLQYWGLDNALLEAIVDKSPEKHGLYTVGTGIPIRSEEEARESAPDYYFVLPYAFIDEFLRRETAFRERGGKFIVPLPEVKIY